MKKRTFYVAIEAKYGFAIAAESRRMEAEGFFDVKRSKKTNNLTDGPNYLCVPEMEWLRPKETYDERIAHDLAFPRLGEEFEWMNSRRRASTADWL